MCSGLIVERFSFSLISLAWVLMSCRQQLAALQHLHPSLSRIGLVATPQQGTSAGNHLHELVAALQDEVGRLSRYAQVRGRSILYPLLQGRPRQGHVVVRHVFSPACASRKARRRPRPSACRAARLAPDCSFLLLLCLREGNNRTSRRLSYSSFPASSAPAGGLKYTTLGGFREAQGIPRAFTVPYRKPPLWVFGPDSIATASPATAAMLPSSLARRTPGIMRAAVTQLLARTTPQGATVATRPLAW